MSSINAQRLENKRPFFFLFFPFSAGILLARYIIPQPVLWQYLLFAAILLSSGALSFHSRRLVTIFITVFALILGIVAASRSLARRDNLILSADSIVPPIACSFTAVLIDDAFMIGPSYDNADQSSSMAYVRAKIETVETADRLMSLDDPIIIRFVAEADLNYRSGDQVKCKGMLQRPSPAKNPGTYDRASWLDQQGIYLEGIVKRSEDISIIQHNCGSPLRQLLWKIRRTLRNGLLAGRLSNTNRAFLIGMTIGEKYLVSDQLQEILMNTNSIHILVVSGLNVTILAGSLFLFLRVFPLSRNTKVIIVILLIFLYAALLDFPAPALRAVIMAGAFLMAPVFRRESDMLNTLAFSAFVSLLFRPMDLFSASFQLSMLIVFSLIMLAVPITKYVIEKSHLAPDRGFLLISGAKRGFYALCRYSIALVVSSFAAFVGSVPLIAWYFHTINPLSILSNALIIPFTGIITPLGLLSSIVGTFSLPAAAALNSINAFFILIMTSIIRIFSLASFSVMHIQSPPLPVAICFYFMLGLVGFSALFLRSVKVVLALLLSAIIVLIPFGGTICRDRLSELVTFCLESSEAHFALLPDGQSLLINTGSEEDASRIIHPFLMSRGINRLNAVVLTSIDDEHIGGIKYIVDRYKVAEVFVPKNTDFLNNGILKTLRNKGTKITVIPAGEIYLPENIQSMRICCAMSRTRSDGHSQLGLIVELAQESFIVLLLHNAAAGDIRPMLSASPSSSNLIVVSDIESAASIKSAHLMDSMSPKLIVLCGHNYTEHDGIDWKSVAKPTAISTVKHGAVMITSLQKTFEVHTMLP